MLDLFPIGFTTITSTAMLFAKTSLNMPATSLVVIGIISPLAGIAGSLVWPMFQRRFAWSNLRILVMLVCLASLLPAYGCLGFLSVFRGGHVRFGGLTTPAEMYVLAMYFVRARRFHRRGGAHVSVYRVLSMEHSRDTRVRSIRSSYRTVRKQDGKS